MHSLETTGIIKTWDGKHGTIQGDDGVIYPFTTEEWLDRNAPEVNSSVRVMSQNGRDASKVESIKLEQMPAMHMTVYSKDGALLCSEKTRFIGGPRRMYSDARAWLETARALHRHVAPHPIDDIGSLLVGEHPLISYRGSVIKYCYGFAIELYLKWILTEANIEYKTGSRGHKLSTLLGKLPGPVLGNLRSLYSTHWEREKENIKFMIADINSTKEVQSDWSTFDKFIRNVEEFKFIIGRYAAPKDYSITHTSSKQLSKEMNMYMDSDGFFRVADAILSHRPNLRDYDRS